MMKITPFTSGQTFEKQFCGRAKVYSPGLNPESGSVAIGLPSENSASSPLRFTGRIRKNSAAATLSAKEQKSIQEYGKAYKKFLKKAVCSSWTAKTILENAEKMGFKPFPQNGEPVKPGGKYYFNNGDDFESVALVVIGTENPEKTGFNIVGAHMDSPQLELKPNTTSIANGIIQLKTRFRGGGSWLTWFNQPLGIAGRIYEPILDSQGKPRLDPINHRPMEKMRFVRMDSPAIVIPIEAIHLNRKLNEGREINKETDLNPVAGLSHSNFTANREAIVHNALPESITKTLRVHHIDLSKASRSELFLFPAMAPVDAGFDKSMILAPGHDDRSMCFAAMKALFEVAETGKPPKNSCIAYFFNNEETGSLNRSGATSRWTENIAGKILLAQSGNQGAAWDLATARENALSKSFIFSADVSHALIPPHASLHDSSNAALLGKGPVIKADSSGHYATTAKGIAMVQDMCKRANIPCQVMSTHQNVPCGTTIGPMIAANTNALTVDIGAAIVSMHAAAELGATVDFYLTKKLFAHFFQGD